MVYRVIRYFGSVIIITVTYYRCEMNISERIERMIKIKYDRFIFREKFRYRCSEVKQRKIVRSRNYLSKFPYLNNVRIITKSSNVRIRADRKCRI